MGSALFDYLLLFLRVYVQNSLDDIEVQMADRRPMRPDVHYVQRSRRFCGWYTHRVLMTHDTCRCSFDPVHCGTRATCHMYAKCESSCPLFCKMSVTRWRGKKARGKFFDYCFEWHVSICACIDCCSFFPLEVLWWNVYVLMPWSILRSFFRGLKIFAPIQNGDQDYYLIKQWYCSLNNFLRMHYIKISGGVP